MKKTTTIIKTPIGIISIVTTDKSLLSLHFLTSVKKTIKPETLLSKKVVIQLNHYFKKPKTKFDLPFTLEGSPFQLKVWQAMQKIPVGKTLTYGELAKQLKTSARAIGNACRNNPIPIIIPCHRIVAKETLGGFSGKKSGKMIDIKNKLLILEAAVSTVTKTDKMLNEKK